MIELVDTENYCWKSIVSSRSSIFTFVTVFVLVNIQSITGYPSTDKNGCNIYFKNEIGATTLNGYPYPMFDTPDKCLQFCVDLTHPQPCVAVEFDYKNETFGCWVHTDPKELEEVYGSDPLVTHYEINRTSCSERAAAANIGGGNNAKTLSFSICTILFMTMITLLSLLTV